LDSFKGTIGASDAVTAVRAGWLSERPGDDVRVLPMADGGEGTLDAFAEAVPGATRQRVRVTGPDNLPVETCWLLLPPTLDHPAGTGVVELASTSGIELLGTPPRLRPLDAHTRGFGEAIVAALNAGVSRLVLGIGSSASTDGGAGMLSALGAAFSDTAGRPVIHGGRGLADISAAELSALPPRPPSGVDVLTDVTNPLLGERGAAAVFGPQKGATPEEVIFLDTALAQFASLINVDPSTPGAGAAGGTGFGLLAWGARLIPGAAAVGDLIGLPDAIASASLVITGEGSYDGQSSAGKAPDLVARLAHAAGTSIALVAGRITTDMHEFTAGISLTELAGSSDAAMREPRRWLFAAGAALAHDQAS